MKNKSGVEQIQLDRKRDDKPSSPSSPQDQPSSEHSEDSKGCSHQFLKIGDEIKKTGEQLQVPVRWGARVMCALCGQRRTLWTDGEVEVL